MKSSEAMIFAVMNAIFAIAFKPVEVLNFSGFSTQLQKLRS